MKWFLILEMYTGGGCGFILCHRNLAWLNQLPLLINLP